MGKGGMVYAEQGADVPMDSMEGDPKGPEDKKSVPPIERTLFKLKTELESPETSDFEKGLIMDVLKHYEGLRDDYMREGRYPRIFKLLGDLDLGGPNTFDGSYNPGTFNPAQESSFDR